MGKKRVKVKRRGGGFRPPMSPHLLAIEGARAARKDFEEQVNAILKGVQERLSRVELSYRDSVRALNSATALLAAVERHLDRAAGPDWDEGIRQAIARKMALAQRLKRIYVDGAVRREDAKASELLEAAAELEALAVELESLPEHAPTILNLLSRARDMPGLRAFADRVEKSGAELDPELQVLLAQIRARPVAEAPPPGAPGLHEVTQDAQAPQDSPEAGAPAAEQEPAETVPLAPAPPEPAG